MDLSMSRDMRDPIRANVGFAMFYVASGFDFQISFHMFWQLQSWLNLKGLGYSTVEATHCRIIPIETCLNSLIIP